MHASQIRANITNRIVNALENGTRPWVQPWRNDPNSGNPTSMASKKEYRGINPLLLTLTAWEKEYAGKWWATFPQWKNLGAAVKPGEKATWVVLYKQATSKRENENGEIEENKYALMTQFPVFCIDQIAGSAVDRFRPDHNASNEGKIDYSNADTLIGSCDVKITHGGNRASFGLRNGEALGIKMPYKSKFNSEEQYYSTLFHELSHWADHRLGTSMKGSVDDDYMFNELVAEISACYLCESCKIPATPRMEESAAYIVGWINKMKKDDKYIFKASSRASKVADFILNKMPQAAEV